MSLFAMILVGLIALLHVYIFWMEAFAWESRGPKVFGGAQEKFAMTKDMALNQGVYNLFLAAGLFWSLFIVDENWARNVATFFLLCVAVAGVVGALSVTKRIIYVQSVPAILALLLVWFS